MAVRPFRILSETAVRALFTLDLALASQQETFERLGRGEAVLPPRLLVEGADDAVAFCYAARLGAEGPAVSKFGSVNPANNARGLPAINAVVTVLDGATGQPIALMDGTSVTEIRTAAATAVAARTIAPRATRLVVVGTGVQGQAHVRAIARTHDLVDVHIWGNDATRAAEAAASLSAQLDRVVEVPAELEVAVASADLVVLCTTSSTPVVQDAWIAPGATVVSVGSFAPDRHEVPRGLVLRAVAVVVDHRSSALTDAGPIVSAVTDGVLAAQDVLEIGDLVVSGGPMSRGPQDIVYYNSIGVGAQDAAAAVVIAEAAARADAGVVIDLG